VNLPYEDEYENLIELSVNFTEEQETKMELRLAFRTLLEAYKAVIEVVRMNNKLEDFMLSVCEKLFEFCVQYKRK